MELSETTFTDPVMRSPMPWVGMVTSPSDGIAVGTVSAPLLVTSRLWPMTSSTDPASISSPIVS